MPVSTANSVYHFMQQRMHRHVKALVAVALIVSLYGFARLPRLSVAQREELASRFQFTRLALPEVPGQPLRSVRPVHPSLKRISCWISAAGASVALNDLDGDGICNDLCYVETRTDQVIVAPVPGTTPRYEPFVLDPAPLPYDPLTMAPTGCLAGDLNEDGLRDVLVYYWGRGPIAFLRRQQTTQSMQPGPEQATEAPPLVASGPVIGRFGRVGDPPRSDEYQSGLDPRSYVACEVAANCGRWYSNAATQADIDGDGHVDLIIGNYFQDDARLLDAKASGHEQMQHSMSRAFNGGRNRLLLWKGATQGAKPTVHFQEAEGVLDEQVSCAWTLAIAAADLDGDLMPELYFANDFGPDRLLHNRSKPGRPSFARLDGVKRLTTPNSKVLGRDSCKGMGADFGDLNGDGWLDIYVSNIADDYALEEGHFVFVSTGEIERMAQGVAPYVERSEALGLARSGWGWESRLDDFDNDGVLEAIQATGFVKGQVNRWPELHELALGNDELLSDPRSWFRCQPGDDVSGHQHNPFFVRAQDGRYYDIARDLGLDDPHVTRGIATADVDGDGDLDFAVANQWEPSYFYRNDCPNPGAFLGLNLLLPLRPEDRPGAVVQSGHGGAGIQGRPAIGAAATVHLPDGRRLVAQVDGGNGHSGARSPELHFGLGHIPRDTVLQVDLHWRDQVGQVHQQKLRLTAGWHTVLLGGSGKEMD